MNEQQLRLFDAPVVERQADRHDCRAAANRYRYGSDEEITEEGLLVPLRLYRCRRCGVEWKEPDL